jgi:spermidine/putrescine-binding protein
MSERRDFWFALIGFGCGLVSNIIFAMAGASHWAIKTQMLVCALLLLTAGAGFELIYRTGGRRVKGSLRIAAWNGYDRYLRRIVGPVRRRLGIRITFETYIGREIVEIIPKTPSDVIIFDIETTQDLASLTRASRLVPLEQLGVTSKYLWDGAEHSLVQKLAPSIGGVTYGLPLRFGTYSVAFNAHLVPQHEVTSLYRLLFGKSDFTKRLYAEKRIGVCDEPLVTMGLLSKIIGNRHPYDLTQEQFRTLCDHLMRMRQGVRGLYWGAKGLQRLDEDLNDGDIWIVPGGGEWNMDAHTRWPRRKKKNIQWRIPEEGAIVWAHCIGVTAHCESTIRDSQLSAQDVAGMINRYFLDPDVLKSVCRDCLYPSFPISYELLDSVDIQNLFYLTRVPISRSTTFPLLKALGVASLGAGKRI